MTRLRFDAGTIILEDIAADTLPPQFEWDPRVEQRLMIKDVLPAIEEAAR